MTTRRRTIALLLGVCLVAAAASLRLLPDPRFDFRIEAATVDSSSFVVRATALNASAKAWLSSLMDMDKNRSADFQVYANGIQTPLFGSCSVNGDEWRFQTAVDPVPGSKIQATLIAGKHQWSATYQVPMEKSQAPHVLAIHPGSSVLPENMIKFYIEFSEPMTPGDFFQHVSLFNETKGQSVPGAFREVELWSPDGKRFTLWLHPGRQKTGVNLNEDEGPVLRKGDKYTLAIADSLTARTGARLQKPARKTFTAGPHDGRCPELTKWSLNHPRKGTREPLTIHFDKPLDWAMLATAISISGVNGTFTTANLDQELSFVPNAAWIPGAYPLSVNNELEDLAGNSLLRPFESQVGAPEPDPTATAVPAQLLIKIDP